MRITCCRVGLLCLSATVAVVGIVALCVMPNFINKVGMEKAHLTEGSLSAENYKLLPVYIYQKVYLFNITNKDDFLKNGAKPNLEEVGPYTFKSLWVKDMSWNADQELEFVENRTYWFVPEMSEGRLDDLITTVDPLLLSALDILENTSWIPKLVKIALEEIISIKSLFVTHKAHELMYDGYDDIYAKLASWIAQKLGIDTPIVNGKVGFLLGQNDTNDGNYTVSTGVNGTAINDILLYNGSTQLKYYEHQCSQVWGTNGEMFNNFEPSSPPSQITFFTPQLCRPWNLKFQEWKKDYRIQHAMFKADDNLFSTSGNETTDQCYQPRGNRIKGIFEGALCQHNSPIFFSLPHFLNGDPELVKNITGMKPDSDKHAMVLGVHPYLGFVTHLNIRMQVNFKTSRKFQDPNDPKIVYPVLWQELVFRDEDVKLLCDQIYDNLEKPKLYIRIVSGLLLALGVVGVIVMLIFFSIKDGKIVYGGHTKRDSEEDTVT